MHWNEKKSCKVKKEYASNVCNISLFLWAKNTTTHLPRFTFLNCLQKPWTWTSFIKSYFLYLSLHNTIKESWINTFNWKVRILELKDYPINTKLESVSALPILKFYLQEYNNLKVAFDSISYLFKFYLLLISSSPYNFQNLHWLSQPSLIHYTYWSYSQLYEVF